jgi:hypothetical protein
VQVGAADAAGDRLDEDIAWAGDGVRDFGYDQSLVAHNRGAHISPFVLKER